MSEDGNLKLEYEEINLLLQLIKRAYDEATPGYNVLEMMRENKIPVEKHFPQVARLDKLYKKFERLLVIMQGGRFLDL